MSGPEDKAKEIERALADRKDADQAMNDKLDGIIAALGGVSERMDAIEAARKDSDKDGVRTGEVTIPHEEARADAVREAKEMAEAQARADAVSTAFGLQAPRPMDGERLRAYRIRLLGHHQHNSPEFKTIDLKAVTDAATFDAIESRIYADSMKASAAPHVPSGMLHERKTHDRSGREISTFHGEPRSWMRQFMMEPQVVERINKYHD